VADYTFAPAPVIEEVTGDLAIGVTGILRDSTTNNPVQIYDLNDSPIASITVGPKGAHGAFKADVPNGVLDFGSVLLPSSSLEQQAAGLIAVDTANEAATDAAAAATSAAAAATSAAAVLGELDGLTSTGDVNAIVATALQTALETLQTPAVVRYNFAASSWSGKVRPATPRPVFFVHPQASRPALNGTTAGGTLAAVPGLDFLFEVGVS
jgi:hypothetical protein